MDWSPLWLSLRVAGCATLWSVLLGLPLAYLLARVRFPGRSFARRLTLLPLVLPPTVLGYALLVSLGRRGAGGVAPPNRASPGVHLAGRGRRCLCRVPAPVRRPGPRRAGGY